MQWTRDGGFTCGRAVAAVRRPVAVNVEDAARRSDVAALAVPAPDLVPARRPTRCASATTRRVDGVPEGIFAYTRTHGDERLLIVLNFTNDADLVRAAGVAAAGGVASIGTHGEPAVGAEVSLAGE